MREPTVEATLEVAWANGTLDTVAYLRWLRVLARVREDARAARAARRPQAGAA